MDSPSIRMSHVHDPEGVGIAALGGPLDARRLMAIQAALSSDRGRRIRSLVLDVNQLRYLNSLGMSALVNLSDHLVAKRGTLHLAGAQPKVTLILEMMGLTEMFSLDESISSALCAIRAERDALASRHRARRVSRTSLIRG